jgi:hypothetical protein
MANINLNTNLDGENQDLYLTVREDVTFAQLKAKITGGNLVPGRQYIVIDFNTVHYIVDTSGTQYLDTIIEGELEPLIVTAMNANKLYNDAISTVYPLDKLRVDFDEGNWLQDLSFADATSPNENGDGTIVPGWKGTITFRHDTYRDNYCGYDFRNCKFRRWKMATPISFDNGIGYWASHPGQTIQGISPDTLDFVDVKTFAEGTGTATYEKCVQSNHIEGFKDNWTNWDVSGTMLSNNVFWLSDESYWTVYSNHIGSENYGNTIAKNFFFNTAGNDFKLNTIGNGFRFNTIGNGFESNIIGNAFNTNSVANVFNGNNIGDSFNRNAIENVFNSNTIGTGFYGNKIGFGFNSNTLGNNFTQNSIASIFYQNTVGDGFTNNRIEDNITGVDFTTATHVYASYNCAIFKRVDGTARLSYFDNSDVQQVVNANA